ncbi:HAUS augmin-like complex subunit 8 [Apodemus speciosus]|uniref:HAUS augmin-like complex subunit 8 n=1 Tax=Apodemus speciosus TaxID=105296 RepID=A0ABQ0F200_APOSI
MLSTHKLDEQLALLSLAGGLLVLALALAKVLAVQSPGHALGGRMVSPGTCNMTRKQKVMDVERAGQVGLFSLIGDSRRPHRSCGQSGKPSEEGKASTAPRDKILSRKALRPDSDIIFGAKLSPHPLPAVTKKESFKRGSGSAGDHGQDGVTGATADDPAVCEDGEQPGSAGEAEKDRQPCAVRREAAEAGTGLRASLASDKTARELSVPLDAQGAEPLQPVLERFKEEYKTLGRALDTTRHELPVGPSTWKSGRELLEQSISMVEGAPGPTAVTSHVHSS